MSAFWSLDWELRLFAAAHFVSGPDYETNLAGTWSCLRNLGFEGCHGTFDNFNGSAGIFFWSLSVDTMWGHILGF